MSEVHKYKLSYEIEQLTKQEALDRKVGACDSFIFHSILYPTDGSRSSLVTSRDGKTGQELSTIELFKGMMDLGILITRRNDLLGWQRVAVDTFVEAISTKLKENRQEQIENNRH